jgi:Zn-dependent M16 (insulinase) family peptidase
VPGDSRSGLEFKGIVYDEMKGALSDPDSAFVHRLNENLFQKSQYRFNAGGDPKHTTDLQYEDLKAFYAEHYHPSNSTVFTYGDMDFTQHLDFMDVQVLQGQSRREVGSEILLEKRQGEPLVKAARFMPNLMEEADQ